MNPAQAVAFGKFGARQRRTIAAAAESASLSLHVAASEDEAARLIEETEPSALLLGCSDEEPEPIAINARASVKNAQLPILALTANVSDLSFESAFSWGADDVVALSSAHPLTRRLRALPRSSSGVLPTSRGEALVAEGERTRRLLVGRVLRNAGYSVTFAATSEDAQSYAQNPTLDLVVLGDGLSDEPRRLIEGARDAGSKAKWVVTCPPRELRQRREALRGLLRVRATDAFAPPEDVLFLCNELESDRVGNQRTSPRILYGTSVGFRGAGRHEDDYGFTYNVSAGGVYVRTLVPPEDDMVWLELCPPRSNARVRLVGRIAWRRGFGPNQRATVPPGFGAAIVDTARADMEAWKASYEMLAEALG